MATRQPSRTWPFLRNLGLLSAVAALAALNWQIWTTPSDIRPIALDTAARTGLAPGSVPTGRERQDNQARNYTDTLARPMFRADRKPFVAEVTPPPSPSVEETVQQQPAAPQTQPPEGLKLVGIMRDGEGRDRALVKSAQSPTASWLEIGDEIDGWRISEIAPSAVTLSADASSIKLDLYPIAASQAEKPAP
jgi:hypothetical protein